MNSYLVSTTTHMNDGRQIGNWEGCYIFADSPEEAIKETAEWEASLLQMDGIEALVVDDRVFYEVDGEERIIEIEVVEKEV